MAKKILISLFFFFLPFLFFAQNGNKKIGLVLSGGGARGLAHLELLKAFEQYQIPISYLGGSSMGAFIGAMYCSGMTCEEIEAFITSKEFNLWLTGKLTERESFLFNKMNIEKESALNFSFSKGATIRDIIPKKIFSNLPIQLSMADKVAKINALTHQNFDSFIIPFFCMGAEIKTKKEKVLRQGNIMEAILISSSFPFFYPPIVKDSQVFVDGGLYNNFPVDKMQDIFNPDVIIGSVTSLRRASLLRRKKRSFAIPNYAELLVDISRRPTKYEYVDSNTHVIFFDSLGGYGVFDFSFGREILALGNKNIQKYLPMLKQYSNPKAFKTFEQRRKAFNNKLDAKPFRVKKQTSKKYPYILFKKYYDKSYSFKKLKLSAFQLYGDRRFDNLKFHTTYDDSLKYHSLNLKNYTFYRFIIDANFSLGTNSINQGHLFFQYSFRDRFLHSFYSNIKFGLIENSLTLGHQSDFSLFRVPAKINIEGFLYSQQFSRFTLTRLEAQTFSSNIKLYNETGFFGDASFSLPLFRNGKIKYGIKFGKTTQLVSLGNSNSNVGINRRNYVGMANYVDIEYNSLNYPSYPTKGQKYYLYLHYFKGNVWGKDSIFSLISKPKSILSFDLGFEKYIQLGDYYSFGFLGKYKFFNNEFDEYKDFDATLMLLPKVDILPEPAIFLSKGIAASQVFIVGLRNAFAPFKKSRILRKFQLFLEGYAYYRNMDIYGNRTLQIKSLDIFNGVDFMFSSNLVWHTPFGPLIFSGNYLGKDLAPSFYIRFGYFFHKKRKLIM